jgi:hypothetical protein
VNAQTTDSQQAGEEEKVSNDCNVLKAMRQ